MTFLVGRVTRIVTQTGWGPLALGCRARLVRGLIASVNSMTGTLYITGDTAADKLLNTNANALLIGMLLDQQVPMEWAFTAPRTLRERLGGTLDASAIAAMDPEDLVAVFVEKPALHRYPAAMAKRTGDLAQHLVDEYGGDPATLWETAGDAPELFARIQAMPGYGKDKSRIFLALLGKRFGRAPEGWEQLAGPFGDDTPRSVADVVSPETLLDVRAYKQMMKEKGRDREGNAVKKTAAKKTAAKKAQAKKKPTKKAGTKKAGSAKEAGTTKATATKRR